MDERISFLDKNFENRCYNIIALTVFDIPAVPCCELSFTNAI